VDETTAPLTDHLAELRSRLIKSLLAWLAATLVAWNASEQIFRALVEPAVVALAPHGGKLQAIAPTEIFFSYLKCALLAGFVIACPVVFWQGWAFVAPGLYASEKKVAVPFVTVSTLLFVGGALFGYFFVLPIMFNFFTTFDNDFVQSAWTMQEVFALTTRMFLAFGVAFELPVVVFFLSLAGIVDARTMLRGTPYAVLVVFVMAAILTPPDVVSQVLLAVPMIALYLAGVAVAWIFGERRLGARR
jgi:sec-independent protein translocase protein TatC